MEEGTAGFGADFFFVIFFVYGCIWTLDGICKKVQDFLLL